LASRDHMRRLLPLLRETMAGAKCSPTAIDAIAYTQGPGLAGALLAGVSFAEALGAALGKPVLPVHHLEGHLLSPLLAEHPPQFPFVALLVSGGHTQLMEVSGVGRYRLLGETLDDAAGEAFDKSAKLLGLGYPGGPALSKLAADGDGERFKLPRPLLNSGDFNFSFSGLKTAVLLLVQKEMGGDPAGESGDAEALRLQKKADIAAAVEDAIVDVLVAKSMAALKACRLSRLVVAGGVGANRKLRSRLNAKAARPGKGMAAVEVFYPDLAFCTDNGAMIAFAGAMRLASGSLPKPAGVFSVRPRWPLQELGGAAE
ncbi:MAG TPA: tRNA (adenosine(37)-N6)-threonylcarbamoyltransferase complex transferase subunit TsaD, partial [Rhodocyclaceae bacterium]|nr:tRNA (adenosine(37)-N6)-threonylcarbamoyltransferase complex transferase subunit TsaD [Rhodocyclaceae bacterium]